MSTRLDILRSLRTGWIEALRATGPALDIGPFVCSFDAHSDLSWINYAVPALDAPAAAWDAALPRLRAAFDDRSRKLRFEFFDELAPGFEAWCVAQGLTRQAAMPAMYCTPADVPTDTTGHDAELTITAVRPETEDTVFADYFAIVDASFTEADYTAPPFATRVQALREELESGVIRVSVLAVNGKVVAVASLNGRGPVVELIGVVTHPDYRRRGYARRISLHQASQHFARGGVAVWLSAGNEVAQRVYESIGFRVLGKQLAYIDGDV